ncbi:MAG: lysophospholipid acyltransferase family protein [Hoeflea sp.]|uniref:lysophospholipid acyltransferase family protein n=1 Tax=Hoeflea sp. TaxID=1940281 RepID=UPI001D45C3A9|nr:lysophospholipid acyltransferase family protein [Hoeflea sp.]MBU4530642.1 lysophospholipid acyltransferase family protein [Alphaproteobacteria bacterium]MBU4544862.1 lysophospholipid acyltransferase family protein [Alphaproteobacteria bacterium]MBU4552005.1 lysophospholipid acyltransferase family protein [Alphaproteobacteria bacterium]MBV1722194.1 lysophospholipid acyltransferase family protein [Hoeflea sp.]MBV1761756.1 lysophospholipid acyltransferase family protein [Hoeflea sp.]
MQLHQLSYANENQPRFKRWLIRSIEGLSGRDRYLRLYQIWSRDIVPTGDQVFARMLELINIRLDIRSEWPPRDLPDGPLVIVANHPFGIGDGIAVLAMAEALGRPFRVLIHNDLMKIPEIIPYSLPISFDETREALAMNMETRHEAVRLLKTGVTIVVFPAGGVATAPKGFGRAIDLPWKMFPARLVQAARASVIPVHFSGQNGRLFHLASRVSMTLRISLLIREFRRLSGTAIVARAGRVLGADELAAITDRKQLLEKLYTAVFELGDPARPIRKWLN